ncbi:MAG: hypothetical protein H6625_03250 [Bdellovibrionaceae bacterium]|nr:hypothetical protein [Pseudobdellovibrionaceae bacterium]
MLSQAENENRKIGVETNVLMSGKKSANALEGCVFVGDTERDLLGNCPETLRAINSILGSKGTLSQEEIEKMRNVIKLNSKKFQPSLQRTKKSVEKVQ